VKNAIFAFNDITTSVDSKSGTIDIS
jgi:hypothetical protein